jgi:alkylhydroperoxidase/carboxymuconolactone decarboxylase family protein YurZ
VGRIPFVDPDDPAADPKAAALLQRARARSGRDMNVLQSLANHPDLLEGFNAFGKVAYSANSLTPAQRELAYLGASVANDCHY